MCLIMVLNLSFLDYEAEIWDYTSEFMLDFYVFLKEPICVSVTSLSVGELVANFFRYCKHLDFFPCTVIPILPNTRSPFTSDELSL
uniref:FBD domain-containing protein n=1 Tax=Setaria viridis TaxID=4556 RepID=A0A4U6W1R1_SETVI|nr:hypothetical protein SEVIR_2G406550v2 [Setaria viridis]